jgi:hypothetical protein
MKSACIAGQRGFMSSEVIQPIEVYPPASQENPVDVQAFCVSEKHTIEHPIAPYLRQLEVERTPPEKSWLGPLWEKPQVSNRRIRMLGYWMKTPEKWATPNTCMAYLEGIRTGHKLDPELALGYLLALEIWALAQVKKEGWRLREGGFWEWLPVIEDLIHKHLMQKPGGPSQKTRERLSDPLAAERKYKYRYRPVNYGKKILAQLQRVYQKDLSDQGKNNFIKREAARLNDTQGAWERLLSVCGMPTEYICYQDVYAPKESKKWNEKGTQNEQWNEAWLNWMMDPRRATPNPEDGFDLPNESIVKLLFDENKTLAEIAQGLGVSVRTVLNLRKESASEKVQDMIEDWEMLDQSREQTLSIWLYRRLNQIQTEARRAAFHAANPALRE